MKVGVRGRLFLFSVLLITVVVLATGFYLEPVLGDWLEKRIEADLLRSARAARELLAMTPRIDNIPEMDRLADRFGQAVDKRVTLIAADGRVLGDSELTIERIHQIDNHGNRPEVVAARSRGYGLARRHSTTVGAEMLYVAIPFNHPQGQGVVRAEVSLESVQATTRRLRMFLVMAGLLALGVAVLIAGIAAHLLTRTLRSLAGHAGRLAESTLGTRLPLKSGDEIGGLTDVLNRIAEDLAAAVASLHQERNRLEAVLEGMHDGVFALDDDRRIILVNRAALSLTGMVASPIGKPLTDLIPAPELKKILDATPEGDSVAVEFAMPGDAERWFMAQATRESGLGSWVVVLHDITDLHHLERMRQEFVANVSHELRTPVSVVLGYTETLLGGALRDEATGREMLEALRKQAVRLSTVITDLLNLSRLDAGRLPLNPQPLTLGPLLREVTETLRPAMTKKRIRLSINITGRERLLADEKALTRVLLNLLDNAVKYVPEGGAITIACREAATRVHVEIQDNGPGIPPQHRERLFERFYRVDPGRSRKLGGTGLGLAIVKSLLESMDGQAGMRPVHPHGALFWITLPGCPAPEPRSGNQQNS